MDREAVLLFKNNKPCTILKQEGDSNPFTIHGKILDVFDTSLSFLTEGRIVVIDFCRIKEIRGERNGYNQF